jgi:hypothetical protein
VVLAVRKDLPPGKKVKCGQCGTKFVPTRHVEALLAKPNDPIDEPAAGQAEPTPIPPVYKPASKTCLAPSKPASRTQLGPRQGAPRSSITHLAMDPLEEIAPSPPVPAAIILADDEIDLLGTDLGVDLDFPKETPAELPRKAAANLPAAMRVEDDRLSPDRTDDALKAPAVRRDQTAPSRPPHRPAKHPENGAASLSVELRSKPDPVARRKKRRPVAPSPKAKQRMPAPVEVEPGDVEVMDEVPIVRPSAVQIEREMPDAPKPLSYQSAEREAASALLEDAPDETEEQETDAAMPEGAQVLAHAHSTPRSYAAPAAMPRPAPAIPHRPTTIDEPTITIDGKKLLQYAVPTLVVAALALGIYYLLLGRGPSRLPVYKTDGVVLFDGEVEGLKVTLLPLDLKKKHRYITTGKVGKDGKFTLGTYAPSDGAPEGRFKVVIDRSLDPEEYKDLNENELVKKNAEIAAHPIKATKYAESRSTDLTVEIIAGKENHLEFNLK